MSTSLWSTLAPPAPPTEPLRGECRADVVIVGAGYSGLSAALHLAEAGSAVVLLEVDGIGAGASGRNNGQVIPTLTRHDPEAIIKHYGEPWGQRLVELLVGSAELVYALIRRHGIDCDAVQNGWIQPAHSPGRVALARRRVEQWSRFGAPVEFLDRDQLMALTGVAGYHGGWLNRSGGHINPLAYARGIAAAAIKAGAVIHEQSPATGLTSEGGAWRVTTPEGAVVAQRVLLATAAYTDDIAPDLKRSIVPVRAYQVATRPLGDNLRKTILAGNHAISDTRMDLRFFRYDRMGRLVSGGSVAVPVMAEERVPREVARRLAQTFPELGEPDFDFVWSGLIGMTTDRLPRLFRLADGVHSWIGCNGRGVALATAMGRAMASLLRGAPEADMPLPVTPPEPIFAQALLAKLGRAALPYYRWRDSREVAM